MNAVETTVSVLAAVSEAAAKTVTLVLLAAWFVVVGLFVFRDPFRLRGPSDRCSCRTDAHPASETDSERKAA
jgi:hypothetical protein